LPRSGRGRGDSSWTRGSAAPSSASSAERAVPDGPATWRGQPRVSDETRPSSQRLRVRRTSRACSPSARARCWKRPVRALREPPDALLVDATGRDHPRRAGLALQLGAALELPTVGVTHRPLLAEGEWPADERSARTPLLLSGELVGYWLRTKAGTRPLAVHAAWRTDPDTAAEVVLSASRARTPEPLRRARRRAREARAIASSDDWHERRERWQT
jgi:endonuclease V